MIDMGNEEKRDRIDLGGREKCRPTEPGNKETIELGSRETWHSTDPKSRENRHLKDPDNRETVHLGSGEKWQLADPENGEKRRLIDPGNPETRVPYHNSNRGLMCCRPIQVGRSDDPTISEGNTIAICLTSCWD